jgi:CubicO group peptidase (beta-lactamase class C family)
MPARNKLKPAVQSPAVMRLAALVVALLLVACGGVPPSPAARTGAAPAFAEWLDREVPALLEAHRVPGAAVALVEGGRVAWTRGYGRADVARRVPVTPDVVFQVASISKPVAAWGVMRLVEEGKLELDAPVSRYLTRWELPPSEFDASGVTVRRLLSHTAGLSLGGYPGMPPAPDALPGLEESLSGTTNGAGDVRLVLEPGRRWQYSGGGYTLLQLLVEEVTGESFAAYLQREVLDRLGMERSAYEWRPELRAVTALGYAPAGRPLPNHLFTEQAAAGLYTTAESLAGFVAAGLAGPNGERHGRGVLRPETVALMYSPAPASRNGFGHYGLGYIVETLPGGERMVGHSGANRGWRSRFAALPQHGAGIVLLTNSDSGGALFQPVLCAWLRDAAQLEC